MPNSDRPSPFHPSVANWHDVFMRLAAGSCQIVNRDLNSETVVRRVTAEPSYSLKVNALAKPTGVVSFNAGITLALVDMCNAVGYASTLMSDLVPREDRFTVLQNNHSQATWLVDYSWLTPMPGEAMKSWGPQYTSSAVTPRTSLSLCLHEACEIWVISHELAHLLLGHPQLIMGKELSELAFDHEFTAKFGELKPIADSPSIGVFHVMELEADAIAAQITFKTMADSIRNREYFVPPSEREVRPAEATAREQGAPDRYQGNWPVVDEQFVYRVLCCVPMLVGCVLGASRRVFSWTERHPSPYLRAVLLRQRARARTHSQPALRSTQPSKRTSGRCGK